MAPDPKRRKDPSDPHIKFLKTSRDLIIFARNHMNSVGAISADIHRLSQNILRESETSGEASTNTNQSAHSVNIAQAINDNEIANVIADHSQGKDNNGTQDCSKVLNDNEVKSRLHRFDENKNLDGLQNVNKNEKEILLGLRRRKKQNSASCNSSLETQVSHSMETNQQAKQPIMYPRIINMEIKNSNELSVSSIKPFEDLKLPDVISPRHSQKSANRSSLNTVLFQYNGPYNRGVGTVMPDLKPKENKPKSRTKKPISAFKIPEPVNMDTIVQPILLHRGTAFNGNNLRQKKNSGSRYSQRIDLPNIDSCQSGLVVKIPTGNDMVNVQLPKIHVTRSSEITPSLTFQKLKNIFKKPLTTTWPRGDLDEHDIETYQLSPSMTSRPKGVISRSISSPMEKDRSPILSPGKRMLKRKDTVILPKINPAPPPTREDNSPCFHRHYLTPSPRLDSFPRITIHNQPGHLAKDMFKEFNSKSAYYQPQRLKLR